jgi:hypothetical protein
MMHWRTKVLNLPLAALYLDGVRLFGYGVYVGDHVPPEDVMGPFCRPGLYGFENPKLVLDDGSVVWGCESWWGPESTIRFFVHGRAVTIVKPTRTPPTDQERIDAAEAIARTLAALEGIR